MTLFTPVSQIAVVGVLNRSVTHGIPKYPVTATTAQFVAITTTLMMSVWTRVLRHLSPMRAEHAVRMVQTNRTN